MKGLRKFIARWDEPIAMLIVGVGLGACAALSNPAVVASLTGDVANWIAASAQGASDLASAQGDTETAAIAQQLANVALTHQKGS